MRRLKSPLFRQAVYGLLSAVLAVLGVLGILSSEQVDSMMQAVSQVAEILVPLLGAGALGVATAKTGPWSDDHTTAQDVIDAEIRGEARGRAMAPVSPIVGGSGGSVPAGESAGAAAVSAAEAAGASAAAEAGAAGA